ncbi:hypothetical protein L3Q82_005630 [Scortum barcoo]|uniref:Uncharacterized protein n=1 Tax=Scortum barcoo TaxID=214431 RepID=A0ACB8V673_9TELE|nr:hypothetical protein L3Q82_005630 [Scortum barcoo]
MKANNVHRKSLSCANKSGNVRESGDQITEQEQHGLTDVRSKLQKDSVPPEYLRRSERTFRNPTEKMRVLQNDEAKKGEKRFLSMYEKWKFQVREARNQLKSYMPETELWTLVEDLKKIKEDIMNAYSEIRDLITPSTDIRRRVDTCESVTKEIISIAYSRAIDDENEFDEGQERSRLHDLLHRDYAKSVYGSAASLTNHSMSDHQSIASSIAARRADAAADLAAKEVNYEMILREEKQRESIRELEEQQRKALEAQKRELAHDCKQRKECEQLKLS